MSMASPVATPGSRWSGSSSDHWSQRGREVEIKNRIYFYFIYFSKKSMRTAVIKQIIGILVRFV